MGRVGSSPARLQASSTFDRWPVRSARFRPWYRLFFWLFVADALVLGWLGSRPAEGPYVSLAQACTAFSFAFFPVVMPFAHLAEPRRELPESIAVAVSARR